MITTMLVFGIVLEHELLTGAVGLMPVQELTGMINAYPSIKAKQN